MKNQFFYTRRVESPIQVAGQDKKYDEFLDSINVNKIIRSVTMGDTLVIILDDFNERVVPKDDINKSGKKVGTKYVRETVQSEVYLDKNDAERFFKLTNIEG